MNLNTHALAAQVVPEPETHPSRDEWVAYVTTLECAWTALTDAVRVETGGAR